MGLILLKRVTRLSDLGLLSICITEPLPFPDSRPIRLPSGSYLTSQVDSHGAHRHVQRPRRGGLLWLLNEYDSRYLNTST